MSRLILINAECTKYLAEQDLPPFACAFMDPPDNIGLDYGDGGKGDKLTEGQYRVKMTNWIAYTMKHAPIVWVSFNARYTVQMGVFADGTARWSSSKWDVKPCVQVITFGAHQRKDLTNNHRPLWRFRRDDAPLYPQQIMIQSERQKMGDPRANPAGKVPGDVFNFPRVTGNSGQRRAWHPTQLHEGLVERCVLMSTKEGEWVLDPFAGTGTTLRVCEQTGRRCVTIEKNRDYCERIADENGLKPTGPDMWEKRS